MPKSGHDREVKRIRGLFNKWREVLHLSDWDMQLSYCDGQYVRGDGEASGSAIASCDANWKYRHATIIFNTRASREVEDDELERIFIHEVMHVHLNEMRDYDVGGIGHEERTATTLSWIIKWAYEAGMKAK